MLYDFQVLYMRANDELPNLMEIFVRAETEQQAEEMVEKRGVFIAVAVNPGEPYYNPNSKWLTKEEAAAYIRSKLTANDRPSLIDKLMADGKLNRPARGHPLFSIAALEKAIADWNGVDVEDAGSINPGRGWLPDSRSRKRRMRSQSQPKGNNDGESNMTGQDPAIPAATDAA